METNHACRIYPIKQYILEPQNVENFKEVKKFVDIITSIKSDVPHTVLKKIYDNVRTLLNTENVICLGKGQDGNEVCIFEFDSRVNDPFKLGGYDEKTGVPFLQLLN